MPTGPGDDILDAIEAGTADKDILTKYKINDDQLKAFKTLHYGLSNQEMRYSEIKDYFPDLNNYFSGDSKPAPKQDAQSVIEKPDFTKPVHEKAATESTVLPSTKQVKQSVDNTTHVESLQQKFDRGAKESLSKINNALAGHDDIINSIIREGRYNKAKEQALDQYANMPKSDMPEAAHLAEARNILNPQETKPWEQPITPEEQADVKESIQTDEMRARSFIDQVSAQKPEEGKDLQHSIYMLDAIQRMKENPNIAIKVNNNLNEIKEGKIKYNAVKQQLTKEEGLLPSLVTGVKEHTREMENYYLFQGPDADVIKLLEKRRASYDPDSVVPVPAGKGGEIGQMMGTEWKPLLKGFAVGAITEPVGGEAAAPYISAAINSPEYYKRAYSTALEQSYDEFRKQGKSPEESLKLARDQAKTEGKLGAAEGFVSSFLGGRIGLKELPKFNVTGGFKSAVNGFIKKAAHGLAETSIEGITDGLVAGYLQSKKDEAAEAKGLFRDSEKNFRDNAEGEITFAFTMAGMTKLGKGLISPDTYKKLRYFISKQNPEAVQSSLGQMVIDGKISKEDADNISKEVKEQQVVDKTVPPDIKDVSRMAMIEKIKERDALEEEKKTIDKALWPEKQARIDKLNEEILEHSKHIKSENETESQTKAETQADAEAKGSGVEQEPGAAQETSQPEADNTKGEGTTAPVADNAITPEAQELLSGLGSGSKPAFVTKKLEQIAKDNGIEVTGKTTPDDIINQLKAKQNAVQEQSTEGIHVPPSSSDSPQVGQGNEGQGTVTEEPAGEEEIKPELDQVKNSFSKQASSIAEKIRSAKRGGKELYGGLLGLGVAIHDGMLETAATVIEGGGTIADAIKSAFNYVRGHTNTHSDDEIQKAVKDELIGKYLLIDEDQQKAVENLIKKAPATISNEKLVENLMQATGMPKAVIDEMVGENRGPKIPPKPVIPTSILTKEERQVSINKINNLINQPKPKEQSWLSKQWEGIKNASAWLDNPYRFITKIIEDINKYYGLTNKEAIPLGRQFEKTAAGRAALKIESFINDIIRGNINGEKLGRLKGEKYKDFQKYLIAKRVIDRLNTQEDKARGGEDVNRQTGNVTRQDAEVMLDELKNKYGSLDDFDKRGKAFQKHMDTMLQTLVASGILSKETYDKIKADNDFYAPFSVVQAKLLAGQDKQPVGISGVIKRIKGIDYKFPTTQGEALTMINSLGDALNEKIISPEEYFNTSFQILNDVKNEGLITEKEYNQHIAGLENPGFALNDILDAGANMIYKAEGMALKNNMLQRLYAYKASDPEGLFIQDVDGFKATTLPDGTTRMVPKPLDQIKVEPGMAPIKLRVDGKDVIVAVNKQAAEKLTQMSNYETSTFLKVADVVNKLFRTAVITLSPGFQVVNFAIDFTRTSMLSRYGPLAGKGLVQPIVNAALFMPQYIEALMHSAMGNVGFKTDTYKQWMKSDSFSKGMFDNLFDNEKRIKEVSAPLAKRLLSDFFKFHWIDIPGSILEQTHKIATHQRGLSVEGFKPEMVTAMMASIVNKNINPNMSAQELKDGMDRLNYEVQNFAGSPNFPQTHKYMKLASMFLQFFSARVKGEMTDYRRVANLFTGKGEGVKFSKQDVIHLAGQFLGATGMIAAYAIKNIMNDDDEKDFDGIPPYHQANYLNIPLGYFDYTDDSGTSQKLRDYAKIPLRGLTATMNVMANSFVKYYKRQNPKEFKEMAEAFVGNASPINLQGKDERELGESLASNLTPVFKYFIEYSFNRDTHNHRNIVPDFVQGKGMLSKYRKGLIKPWEVATKKTPQWAKDFSKYLFDTLGISISAIELDHMEDTMGNPTELYNKAVKKRLLRSESKYPLYTPKENNKNTSSATVTPEGQ